jgi:hypothetical protein
MSLEQARTIRPKNETGGKDQRVSVGFADLSILSSKSIA